MFRTILITFTLVSFLKINSYSDVMFIMEYNQTGSDKPEIINVYIKNDLMKMDFLETGSSATASMIFNAQTNEMIALDHSKKSYFVMDKETIKRISGQVNAAILQMEEAMKGMSPEEREMMNKMMKGKMPDFMGQSKYTEPVFKQLGNDMVNGYSCIKYDVFKGDEKTMQYCVTDWSNIKGGDEIKSTMLRMSLFMEELYKSLSSGSNMIASSMEFERNVFTETSKLGGFPIHAVNYYGGAVSGITSFTSSNNSKIDISYFEPPSDYKKQNLNM